MKKILGLILSVAIVCCVGGCQKKGTFEKAGERTDEIIDNVKDGDPVLHKKGPAEKAGDAIDDAVKDMTDKSDDD